MTKADLVGVIAKASGITKSAAERALNAFVASVKDSYRKNRRVTIVGLGTFYPAKRAARNGRDPRTGNAIRIPAAKILRFRSSKSLKSAIK